MKYNVPFLRNKAFRENRTVGRDYVLIYLIKHILFPFIHIATFTTECFFFFFFLLATVIVAGGFISVKLNQTLGGKIMEDFRWIRNNIRRDQVRGILK